MLRVHNVEAGGFARKSAIARRIIVLHAAQLAYLVGAQLDLLKVQLFVVKRAAARLAENGDCVPLLQQAFYDAMSVEFQPAIGSESSDDHGDVQLTIHGFSSSAAQS